MTYMSGRRLRKAREQRRKRRQKKDPILCLERLVKSMLYYAENEPWWRKTFGNHSGIPTKGTTMRFQRYKPLSDGRESKAQSD